MMFGSHDGTADSAQRLREDCAKQGTTVTVEAEHWLGVTYRLQFNEMPRHGVVVALLAP